MGSVLTTGPVRAGEHLAVDVCSLPATSGVTRGGPGHEEALAVLTARYVWGHDPIDRANLVRWTGLTLAGARQALAGAYVAGESMGLPPATFGAGLARADLVDPVENFRTGAGAMLALPSFDKLYVSYKGRSCLTDEADETLIYLVGSGMFRSIAVADRHVIAVRAPSSQVMAADGHGAYEGSARRAFDD